MRALLCIALAVALANATAISWTGYGHDNQWTNPVNWYPDQVPGPNDDVTINKGMVQVTIATGVSSLMMGNSFSESANLTLFQAFYIGNGGMTVQGNGNLIIQTGLATVSGTVNIAGSLQFVDGVISGQWTIGAHASADLSNMNMKGFSGVSFVSQGSLALGGLLQLNQSSVISLQSSTTASKNLQIQNGDGSSVLFDASAAQFTYSTGTLLVQAPVKLGAFTLSSGNITILDSLTFAQSLNVPAGSYIQTDGSAVLNMTAGLTGAGVVSLASTTAMLGGLNFGGSIQFNSGDVIVSGTSSIATATLTGANAVFQAATGIATFAMSMGTTSGSGVVTVQDLTINSKGLTLGSSVVANKTATLMSSMLTFSADGHLTIDAAATATVVGAFSLTGPAFIPGLTNNGKIVASAAFSSQNIDIRGSGSVSVASTFKVNTATVSQNTIELASGAVFSGQNTFLTVAKIASKTGGDVKAVIGDYKLTCKAECDNVSTPGATTPTSPFSFSA